MNRVVLLGFLLIAAPLAHAQTGPVHTPPPAPASAPASVSTNAPADAAPFVSDATASPQVTAPDQVNTPPRADEIYDVRPPFFFLRSWLWLWLVLAVAAIITLLVFLVKWLNPDRQLSPKTAYELTLEKLEKARALLREDDPKPYAVLVSETIRAYLGQRFQSPCTRRTTEEFLRLMDGDTTTPLAEHRDLLREFLQSCDLVKFARYQPTLSELEQVHQRAFSFVTATRPLVVPTHANGRTP